MSPRKVIKGLFPNLQELTSFKVTSDPTYQYNCIAWAAGDSTQWWWPSDGHYWPAGIAREETIEAFTQAFVQLGYAKCADGRIEAGLEKVAIYCDPGGTPTHAARQLDDGKWTSKLGQSWDISHTTTMGMECATYGVTTVYMQRAKAK